MLVDLVLINICLARPRKITIFKIGNKSQTQSFDISLTQCLVEKICLDFCQDVVQMQKIVVVVKFHLGTALAVATAVVQLFAL